MHFVGYTDEILKAAAFTTNNRKTFCEKEKINYKLELTGFYRIKDVGSK